ncbi:MAG: tRNA dihydrouridine(20/20a) synthase DusA [Alphaproteobacteria bacterium]|nr:tRNA dihydrouridine(20/20a) synthase DusA [Alphaproteobacteria bacterium]
MSRLKYRFSVAPMMEWTDRHCRFFHRILSRRARLYSEMVTTGALIHGPRARLLAFDASEHPVALQIGGSEPQDLAMCARMAEGAGYDEINLNIGCPSPRVQKGAFGACLMREPELVGECVSAMRSAVRIPVTVKCRIGVDDQDPERALLDFVDKVAAAGCDTFVVHARKALLQGLSPKDNRDVPPLNYELVYRLKRERPDLTIVINGGIAGLDEAKRHLAHVDGVMLGRAAYQSPWLLASADAELFGDPPPVFSRHAALHAFMPYVARQLANGAPLNAMTKHVLGLFNGLPGARAFRRHLSENATKPGAGLEVLRAAMALVPEASEESAAA